MDPNTNSDTAWIMVGKPCVEKMPATLQDLWELLRDVASEGNCHAYIEQIHWLAKLINILPDDPNSYEDAAAWRYIENEIKRAKKLVAKTTPKPTHT